MVADRFEDEPIVPFDELVDTAFEKYLEDMEDEEGTPMNRKDFKEWYIGAW